MDIAKILSSMEANQLSIEDSLRTEWALPNNARFTFRYFADYFSVEFSFYEEDEGVTWEYEGYAKLSRKDGAELSFWITER